MLLWWTKRFISLPFYTTLSSPWYLLSLTPYHMHGRSARRPGRFEMLKCRSAQPRDDGCRCHVAAPPLALLCEFFPPRSRLTWHVCLLLRLFDILFSFSQPHNLQFNSIRCAWRARRAVPHFATVCNVRRRLRLPRLILWLEETCAPRALILLLTEFICTLWLISFSQVHIMTIVSGRSALCSQFFFCTFSHYFVRCFCNLSQLFLRSCTFALHCYC